jgi:hypothetical protein
LLTHFGLNLVHPFLEALVGGLFRSDLRIRPAYDPIALHSKVHCRFLQRQNTQSLDQILIWQVNSAAFATNTFITTFVGASADSLASFAF